MQNGEERERIELKLVFALHSALTFDQDTTFVPGPLVMIFIILKGIQDENS